MSERTNSVGREVAVLVALLGAIGAVYVAVGYPDHNWGDDFAQYLQQAINISRRVDMATTGYVYSRYNPEVGPPAYPPGFPLLLVPTYVLFGLDMRAFHAEMIGLQLLALVPAYLLYRRHLGPIAAWLLTGMLGLSPYVIVFTRQIMSDIPAMLFAVSFLYVVERPREPAPWTTIVVATMLASAGCATRTAGVAAPLALLAADLLRRRRPTRLTWWTIAGTACLVGLGRFAFGSGEASYGDQFASFGRGTIAINVRHYFVSAMSGFWAGPSLAVSDATLPILWILAVPLVVCGFVVRCCTGARVLEAFTIIHIGIVLVWPSAQEVRFLYPVLPLLLLYAGIGFERVAGAVGGRIDPHLLRGVRIAIAAGLVLIYTVRTVKVVVREGPLTDGPHTSAATAMFEFFRARTPADAVLVGRKPKALAFYTGRRAARFPSEQSPRVVVAFLRDIGAAYAVSEHSGDPVNQSLQQFADGCSAGFLPVFDNDGFTVYRLDRGAIASCAAVGGR